MVKAKCFTPGCAWRIEDAPHVDGAIDELKAHFRAVHPTKWFRAAGVGEKIESYNLTWDELMVIYYGEGQEAMIPDRYMATDISRNPSYNDEVLARAAQIIEEHNNANAAEAAAPGDNPGGNARARRRFARGNGVIRGDGVVAQQMMPPVAAPQVWFDANLGGPAFLDDVEEDL